MLSSRRPAHDWHECSRACAGACACTGASETAMATGAGAAGGAGAGAGSVPARDRGASSDPAGCRNHSERVRMRARCRSCTYAPRHYPSLYHFRFTLVPRPTSTYCNYSRRRHALSIVLCSHEQFQPNHTNINICQFYYLFLLTTFSKNVLRSAPSYINWTPYLTYSYNLK